MKYVFQFCRILGFCFLGEVMHMLLPLPVPSGVWGMALLLIALKTGICSLDSVRDTGLFLTSVLPLLFVPAAAGVMALRSEIADMLLPILLALVPITFIVMAVSGRVTQMLISRGDSNGSAE